MQCNVKWLPQEEKDASDLQPPSLPDWEEKKNLGHSL